MKEQPIACLLHVVLRVQRKCGQSLDKLIAVLLSLQRLEREQKAFYRGFDPFKYGQAFLCKPQFMQILQASGSLKEMARQIFLSKKENKWLGLILPIISFCISLIAVFNIVAYTTTGSLSLQTLDENGVVIQEEVLETPNTTQPVQDIPSLIFLVGSVFLLYWQSTSVAGRSNVKEKRLISGAGNSEYFVFVQTVQKLGSNLYKITIKNSCTTKRVSPGSMI